MIAQVGKTSGPNGPQMSHLDETDHDMLYCGIGGHLVFEIRPRGYKTFFVLNSAEGKISTAQKI